MTNTLKDSADYGLRWLLWCCNLPSYSRHDSYATYV